MPGNACGGRDCVEAFFNFTLQAQARADELELGKLPIVLSMFAWGLFDASNPIQKTIVQRAAKNAIDMSVSITTASTSAP